MFLFFCFLPIRLYLYLNDSEPALRTLLLFGGTSSLLNCHNFPDVSKIIRLYIDMIIYMPLASSTEISYKIVLQSPNCAQILNAKSVFCTLFIVLLLRVLTFILPITRLFALEYSQRLDLI